MKLRDSIEMKQSVLALHDRVGQAQLRLVNRVSARWVQSNYGKDGRNEQTVLDTSSSVAVDDAALEDMMKLVSIFVDANRLRMKVITGLVKLMNDSQAAQYLESLCKFFPGFTL
ncbi:unnamed protein product [Arabidopsis lyrata]|nr:unnamed protein product [Arabidopsis lyrata]